MKAILVSGAVALVACGGGGSGGGGGNNGNGNNTIGPGGGSFTANGVTVTVPAGALSTTVTLTSTATTATPAAGAFYTAGSSLYEFGPDGTAFGAPVTVTLPLPQGAPASSTIYWSRPGSPGSFDNVHGTVSGSTISAEVNHFSTGFVGAPVALGCSAMTDASSFVAVAANPSTTLPTPAGGPFADGAYRITSMTYYGMTTPPYATTKGTLLLSAGTWKTVGSDPNATYIRAGTYTLGATSVTLTETCSSTGAIYAPYSGGYTSDGTTLTIIAGPVVETYVRL